MDFFASNYNLIIVCTTLALLGATSALVGSIVYFRNKSMISDAISHASFPGVILFAILLINFNLPTKNFYLLLFGASLSSFLGIFIIRKLSNNYRIDLYSSIAIVLSSFFAAGIIGLSYLQTLESSDISGLNSFIFGKAASISLNDLKIISIIFLVISALYVANYRLIKSSVFDESFTKLLGVKTDQLDIIFTLALVLVSLIGLTSIGVILSISYIIMPIATARLISNNYSINLIVAIALGITTSVIGAVVSYYFSNIPTGPAVISVMAIFFVTFLLFSPVNGLFNKIIQNTTVYRRIGQDHILRRLFENFEYKIHGVRLSALKSETSLNSILYYISIFELLIKKSIYLSNNQIFLTKRGLLAARKIIKNHRLWELYIQRYSNFDLSHIDYSADLVEHYISKDILKSLIKELKLSYSKDSSSALSNSLNLTSKVIKSIHPLNTKGDI